MTEDDFARLVGGALLHRTPEANSSGLRALGMLRPAEAARRAGHDPGALVLRDEPIQMVVDGHTVTLNHQRPLRAGRSKGADFLDDGDVAAWSAGLDERLFFWPARGGAAFEASLGDRGGAHVLRLDARAILRTFPDDIWLSPINSGAALRRPARRGPWLYVSARDPVETFRRNRMERGLVQAPDTVAEVSLTADISPDLLAALTLP